jgi:photosynthetic reaction center cytochrome c subunit
MKSLTVVAGLAALAAGAFALLVPSWEAPPPAAMEVSFPQGIQFQPSAERAAVNRPLPPLPPAAEGGPAATEVYKNVQVLTDVSAAEFMRMQEAMTQWVSPQQGCGFCHAGTDWASDAKPAKQAARVMLRMTRHLNTEWSSHTAAAGVTCYTCHRGQPVPAEIWFPSPPTPRRPMVAPQDAWHEAADTVRKFFPDAGLAEYFLADEPIAAQSTTVEPGGTTASYDEVKRIYEMMMTMSDGIGANCGLCHNSRDFQSWDESTPYRWNAWYAIRMLRDLNRNYLPDVAAVIPQSRLREGETRLPVLPAREAGAQQGNGLVLCGTCHRGVLRPLGGASMAHDYPALAGRAAP